MYSHVTISCCVMIVLTRIDGNAAIGMGGLMVLSSMGGRNSLAQMVVRFASVRFFVPQRRLWPPWQAPDAISNRSDERPERKKPARFFLTGFALVAGTGFEPVTFRL